MILLIKLTTLFNVLSILLRISHSSVISAAVIRRHTVTYKDVPTTRPQIRHQVVYIPASKVNLFMQFKSKSNKIFAKQEHKGRPGSVQHSIFEEAPHILKHEVQKPVIQTVREVIIPYRQITQEIKPVVEEVKTVVSTRVPQKSVYMNFGDSVPNNYFQYSMAVNHESAKPYDSGETAKQISEPESHYSLPESKPNSYDLSSIYGINPSVQQLTDLMPEPKPTALQNDNHVYEQPMVYGLTSDIQHIPGHNKEYGYVVNTIHEKPVQYNDQNNYENSKNHFYGQTENYAPAYSYQEKPETNYNDQGYYSQDNNIDNSGRYYSNGYQSLYNNEGYDNSGYSEGNSGDLAMSDGSELQSQSPEMSFFDLPIGRNAILAQFFPSLSYPYNYDNQSPALSY